MIKMPLGMVVVLGPGNIVLDADPASPQGAVLPRNFRPMSIVAKRSPISATVEHLFLFLSAAMRSLLFQFADPPVDGDALDRHHGPETELLGPGEPTPITLSVQEYTASGLANGKLQSRCTYGAEHHNQLDS